MTRVHVPVTKAVECPQCGESASVPVPDEDVEPTVSRSVAAFGEHETVACSNGHRCWVYFC